MILMPREPHEVIMSFFKSTRIRKFSVAASRDLQKAFEAARNGSSVLARDRDFLQKRLRPHLLHQSHEARMIWGRWLSHYLSEKFGVTRAMPIFLVTLCDINCVTSVSDKKPDIRKFKAQLQRGLRGLSFLGALEPAYYTNVQSGSQIDGKKCIFWHLHVLVWDICKRDLRGRLDDLEASEKYLAITEQFSGTHMKKIKPGELPNTVGYIFKPPANAYRLSLYDGVRYKMPVTLARQGQNRLRPGERVRLFHIMKEMSLWDLAVAGGDGKPLLTAITKSARDECGYTKMKAREYAQTKTMKKRMKTVAIGDMRRKRLEPNL
jgi:hypothetical protein